MYCTWNFDIIYIAPIWMPVRKHRIHKMFIFFFEVTFFKRKITMIFIAFNVLNILRNNKKKEDEGIWLKVLSSFRNFASFHSNSSPNSLNWWFFLLLSTLYRTILWLYDIAKRNDSFFSFISGKMAKKTVQHHFSCLGGFKTLKASWKTWTEREERIVESWTFNGNYFSISTAIDALIKAILLDWLQFRQNKEYHRTEEAQKSWETWRSNKWFYLLNFSLFEHYITCLRPFPSVRLLSHPHIKRLLMLNQDKLKK